MTTWTTKIDWRESGQEVAITAEPHVVGEDTANYVFLTEVPLQESPETVVVSGPVALTRVTTTPAAGQYRVVYQGRLAGAIEFNAAQNGVAVTVSYKGRGSNMFARDVNNLQLYKLDSDGSMPLTGPLRGSATATAAAPAFAFAGDEDTGLFRVSANRLALATGGTQRVTVDGQLVGINVNTPTYALDVSHTTAAALLRVSGSAASDVTALIQNSRANDVAAGTRVDVRVSGTTGGNPFVTFTVPTAVTWSVGLANADGDKFVIALGTGVGTQANYRLSIDAVTNAVVLAGLLDATALRIGGTSVVTTGRVLENVTLDAALVTSGTLADARLPGTVVRTNAASVAFAGTVSATGAVALSLNAGAADYTGIELFARTATPSTRSALLGMAAAGTNDLTIRSELGRLLLGANGALAFSIELAGHLLAAADGAQDIGALASGRVRDIHATGRILTNGWGAFGATQGTIPAVPHLEVGLAAGNVGVVQAYDRGTSAFLPLRLDGTNVSVVANGAGVLSLQTSATARWNITAAGHLLAAVDAAYDIGTTSANRPRHLYVAGDTFLGTSSGRVMVGGGQVAGTVLSVGGGPTASVGAANGVAVVPALSAAANNDELRAVFINPAAVVGGFTGTTHIGLAVADITGGATNFAIRTGAGLVQFGGALRFTTDNAVDIGEVAAFRPRTLYVGTSVVSGSLLQIANGSSVVRLNLASSVARLGSTTANTPLTFTTNNVDRWQLTNSGHLFASTDGTVDIGDVAGNRPRNLFLQGVATVSSLVATNGGGAITVRPGTLDNAFLTFNARTASPTTRSAAVGVLTAGSSDISVLSDLGAVRLASNGIDRWIIASDGVLSAATDGTTDVGRTGSNRPRHGYFSGTVTAAAFVGDGSGLTNLPGSLANGTVLNAVADMAAPSAGTMALYASSRFGDVRLMSRAPTGRPTPFQVATYERCVAGFFLTANSGALTGADTYAPVALNIVGINCTIQVDGAFQLGINATDTSWPFVQLRAFTSGSPPALLSTGSVVRGGSGGLSGFLFVGRISAATVSLATAATWVFGLGANVTNVALDTATTQGVYFHRTNTEANWFIAASSGSRLRTDTGMPLTAGHTYVGYIWAGPNGTTVHWLLENITLGTSASGSINTNLPAQTTVLRAMASVSANADVAHCNVHTLYTEQY